MYTQSIHYLNLHVECLVSVLLRILLRNLQAYTIHWLSMHQIKQIHIFDKQTDKFTFSVFCLPVCKKYKVQGQYLKLFWSLYSVSTPPVSPATTRPSLSAERMTYYCHTASISYAAQSYSYKISF